MQFLISLVISFLTLAFTRKKLLALIISWLIYSFSLLVYTTSNIEGKLNLTLENLLAFAIECLGLHLIPFLIVVLVFRSLDKMSPKNIQQNVDTQSDSVNTKNGKISTQGSQISEVNNLTNKDIFNETIELKIRGSKSTTERQRLNLLKTWSTFIKDEDFKQISVNSDILYISSVLSFPMKMINENQTHYLFCQQVVHDYNEHHLNPPIGKFQKCMFKPSSILLYPKDFIAKAIKYIYSHPKTLPKVKHSLTGVITGLNYYLDVPENVLPSQTEENKEFGRKHFDFKYMLI